MKSLILLAVSFIGYYALWMFFCRVFQMPPQRLDESLISQSDSLLSSLPSMLYHTNRDYLRFLFHVKISQGLLLPVLNFIIIILILIRLISFLVNPKLPILNKIARLQRFDRVRQRIILFNPISPRHTREKSG